MKVAANLSVGGTMDLKLGLLPLATLPSSSAVNAIFNVNGVLYKCVTATPLVFQLLDNKVVPRSYSFTQAVSSKTWTITHNLNTLKPLLQCYDAANTLLAYNSAVATLNTLTVTFGANRTGTALVVAI